MTGQSPRGGSGRCPRSGSLPAQTHSSSWEWECARVQTRLLLWAPVHVQLHVAATPGKLPLLRMPRCAHAVHTRMCWHTGTLPAWPRAPTQRLAHLSACTHTCDTMPPQSPSPPVAVPTLAQTDKRKVPSVPWQGRWSCGLMAPLVACLLLAGVGFASWNAVGQWWYTGITSAWLLAS